MKFSITCIIFFVFSTSSFAQVLNLNLNLDFKSGQSHVTGLNAKRLKQVLEISKNYPAAKFFVSGHTDSLGAEEMNYKLSEARAKSVKDYLNLKSISDDKISYKAFGEVAPIADNSTKLGRAANRRVILSVYGINEQKLRVIEKKSGYTVIENESEKLKDYVAKISQAEKVKPVKSKAVAKQAVVSKPKVISKRKAVSKSKTVSTKKYISKPKVVSRRRVVLKRKSTSKKKLKEAHSSKSKNRYLIGLGININTLDAKDDLGSGISTEGEWVSKSNYLVQGAYQYNIAKSMWLGLRAEYHIQDYESLDSTIFTWDEEVPNLLRGALIFDYEISNKIGLGFDLDYNQESFIFETINQVSLLDDSLFGASLRGLYKFYDSKSYSSRAKLKVSYPFSGADDLIEAKGRVGVRLAVDVSFKSLLKSHELNLEFYYGLRNFENSQNEQKEEIAGLNLSLRNLKWL